jgi:hypothetical protein
MMNPQRLIDTWTQEEADMLQRTRGWVDPEELEVRIEDRIEWEMATMSTAHRLMMRAWLSLG